jgi:hypothetical protein
MVFQISHNKDYTTEKKDWLGSAILMTFIGPQMCLVAKKVIVEGILVVIIRG